MNLATSEKKLQGKLKLMKLLNEDTQTIIDQRNLEAIEGHLSTIRNKLSEVQDLKVSIQELKFEDGKDETDIRTWSAQMDKGYKAIPRGWYRVKGNRKRDETRRS